MSRKEELNKELIKKLVAAGFVSHNMFETRKVYSGDCNFMGLSEEQIEELLSSPTDDVTTYKEFMFLAGKSGVLKIKPYIEGKSLVLNYDRFLHDFRGYYFQVSGSINGAGAYGQSVIPFAQVRAVTETCSKELKSLIVLSLLTSAAGDYSAYTDLLGSDEGVLLIEEFMNASYEDSRDPLLSAFSVKDAMSLVSSSPISITDESVSFSDVNRRFKIVLSGDWLSVSTKQNSNIKVTNRSICIKELREYNSFSMLPSLLILISFLLNMSGVNTYWYTFRFNRKLLDNFFTSSEIITVSDLRVLESNLKERPALLSKVLCHAI